MKQLSINFPPPMTPAQLSAAIVLQRMVEERRNSFAVIDFSKRRKAALKRRDG